MGSIVFWGYAGGIAGSFTAAYLIERIGRKYTCASAYTFAAVAIYMLFHIPADLPQQYLWMILTVFGFGAGNSATHVYASELFPTEIRRRVTAGRRTYSAASPGKPHHDRHADRSARIPGDRAGLGGPIVGAVLVLLLRPRRRTHARQIAARLGRPDFALLYLRAARSERRLPSLPGGGRTHGPDKDSQLLKEIGLAACWRSP